MNALHVSIVFWVVNRNGICHAYRDKAPVLSVLNTHGNKRINDPVAIEHHKCTFVLIFKMSTIESGLMTCVVKILH